MVIDESRGHNHLDFLFVKVGCQNRGIGGFIWNGIESRHPDTVVWETVTPYFDIRNIHFYINKCGFHAVEFFIEKESEGDIDGLRGTDRMFRFEKKMR